MLGDFITPITVMAGLDPAIHASPQEYHVQQLVRRRDVDARLKAGHDVLWEMAGPAVARVRQGSG